MVSLSALMLQVQATYECYPQSTTFPRVLGGLSGTTLYNTIEISPGGIIALGGSSTSSDFTGVSGQRGIVTLMDQDGTYKWVKRVFNSVTNEVGALTFTEDESEVISVHSTTSSRLYIFRWSVSSGTYVKGYIGASSTDMYTIRSGTALENDGYLYLAMQYTDTKSHLISFELRDSSTLSNARFYIKSDNANTYFSRVLMNNAKTHLILVGNVRKSGNMNLAAITMDKTDGDIESRMSVDWSWGSSGDHFYAQDAYYTTDSGKGYLFVVSTNSAVMMVSMLEYEDDGVDDLDSNINY
jgi:hypothetical protein